MGALETRPSINLYTLSLSKSRSPHFRAMKRHRLLLAAAALLAVALPLAQTAPVGVACESLTQVEGCVECTGTKCLACQRDRAATWSSDSRVTEVSGKKLSDRPERSAPANCCTPAGCRCARAPARFLAQDQVATACSAAHCLPDSAMHLWFWWPGRRQLPCWLVCCRATVLHLAWVMPVWCDASRMAQSCPRQVVHCD